MPTYRPELFPKRLKQARNHECITQECLGAFVGVSKGAISTYEMENKQPRFSVLCGMAEVLNVSVNWLLGAEDA